MGGVHVGRSKPNQTWLIYYFLDKCDESEDISRVVGDLNLKLWNIIVDTVYIMRVTSKQGNNAIMCTI